MTKLAVVSVASVVGAALASGMWSQTTTVRAAGGLLATDAVLRAPAETRSPPLGVRRSRLIALDARLLPHPRLAADVQQPRITLDLFPDVSIEARFDHFDANASGGVTWVGHVEDVPGAAVTLVYADGLVTGSVIMPRGTFQIRPASDAARAANPQTVGVLHTVSEIDQAAFPREAEPLRPVLSRDALLAAETLPMRDTGDTIDVLLLYTAAAQAYAGGPGGIANLINLGISETNTTYANSGVQQRVRLVGAALVPYAETNLLALGLNDLRLGLGALSGVLALRNSLRADLVQLLVRPLAPDACGVAYLMTTVSTAFEVAGYSIVEASCVSPNLTMAHEFGHNMGALHDWYVSPGTLPFSYAHGYVNTQPGNRFRTVMSYNDLCVVQGFNCTRLLAWSNPGLRFRQSPFCRGSLSACPGNIWFLPGDQIGIPGGTRANCLAGNPANTECDADDARTLNNTALTVANLRTAQADR